MPWNEEVHLQILHQLNTVPRDVPFWVRLQLRLYSNSTPILGWFLVGFLFMFALFALAVSGLENDIPRTWVDAGKCTITNIKPPSSQGKFYTYRFETTGNDAEKISGTSYGKVSDIVYKVGDEVPLQKSGNRYRVEGLRLANADVGIASLFVLLGLFFGSIVLYKFPIYSWFAGGQAIRILERGTPTSAKYVGKSLISIVNNQIVMEIEFEYQVDDEKYTASARVLETSRLTDTKYTVVLYDTMEPMQSVVLDGLPHGIYFDELTGQFLTNPLRCALPLLMATFVSGEIIAIILLVIRAF